MQLEEAIKDIKIICEYLKESDYMSIDKDTKISLETVLNHLIKQEKMIENAKEKYISKDKIKEKIEEIKNYTYSSKEERQCQNYGIERLKELMEVDNE